MPIPLIFGAAAVGAALFGSKKAYDAYGKNGRAGRMNRRTEYEKNKARKNLDAKRDACRQSLDSLGYAKLGVLNNVILPFVNSFKKIHNVDFCSSVGLEELSKFRISKEELSSMEKMGKLAANITNGVAGGVAVGALTAIGAYGAATTFGVAGTGTAIASLSGAAATNATLAFLGGGSIAVGGFGIAGGVAVLGSVVTAPALVVMGLVLDAKAEENLENAMANRTEAEKILEQCETAGAVCNAITERCNLLIKVIDGMSLRMGATMRTVNSIIKKYGENVDFRDFSETEQKHILKACGDVKAFKKILDTPVLEEDGSLTSASAALLKMVL